MDYSPETIAEAIAGTCVSYIGRENLVHLAVVLNPRYEEADIIMALAHDSEGERRRVYGIFLDEVLPLYAQELALNVRFYAADAHIFTTAAAQHSHALI